MGIGVLKDAGEKGGSQVGNGREVIVTTKFSAVCVENYTPTAFAAVALYPRALPSGKEG